MEGPVSDAESPKYQPPPLATPDGPPPTARRDPGRGAGAGRPDRRPDAPHHRRGGDPPGAAAARRRAGQAGPQGPQAVPEDAAAEGAGGPQGGRRAAAPPERDPQAARRAGLPAALPGPADPRHRRLRLVARPARLGRGAPRRPRRAPAGRRRDAPGRAAGRRAPAAGPARRAPPATSTTRASATSASASTAASTASTTSSAGPCGDENERRRTATVDLRGRVALITGARVKIGFHAALMLLRAGCAVVACTRFPRDAAARYAREPDFEAWRDRLTVHGIDLRHSRASSTSATGSTRRCRGSTSSSTTPARRCAARPASTPTSSRTSTARWRELPAALLPHPAAATRRCGPSTPAATPPPA